MTLPRRANGIRNLATSIAAEQVRAMTLRQTVSDRIGYLIASGIGALAYEAFHPHA